MKNLKILFVIAIISLTAFTISCTKDEGKNSTQSSMEKFSKQDLDKMKADFISIMKSNEYKTFHNFTYQMDSKMKDENFTFQKREDFVAWISTPQNLSKTSFESKEVAIQLYDNSIIALGNLRLKYKTFYDNLLKSDTDEFLEICAPEMVHPQLPSSQKSCAQGCVNTAIAAYHIADITYAYAMSTGDLGMMYYGGIAYQHENQHITASYMTCFGNCPV